MSPLEQAVLQRKLQHLRELVALLRQESGASLEAFLGDRRLQLLVERLVHDYEAIDPRRVHAALGTAVTDLEALIKELEPRVAM